MKNENLEIKLASYSALAAGLIFSGQLTAQIDYTDLNPDKIIQMNDSFAIDINKDGLPDFNFNVFNYQASNTSNSGNYIYKINVDAASMEILDSNNEVWFHYFYNYVNSSMNMGPAMLNYFDPIRNAYINSYYSSAVHYFTWKNSYDFNILNAEGSYYYNSNGNIDTKEIKLGFFGGKQNKFIGVRINQNSNWHYGWIRVDVASDAKKIIVKDYAFCTLPNQPVRAGKTVLSVKSLEENDLLDIFISNKQLHLNFKENFDRKFILQIFSNNGKEIYKEILNFNDQVIDLSYYVPGAYIVRLLIEEEIYTKLIIIQ